MLEFSMLKDFLEEKYIKYNKPEFIENDPVRIPHLFTKKEDIEISGFLAATIAWGQRPVIIKNSYKLVQFMDNAPYDFILNAKERDIKAFNNFKHRTFNGTDCIYFIRSIQNIYKKHKGLEHVFYKGFKENNDIKDAIIHFREIFFELPSEERTRKHVANVKKHSAAKRINMFIRWMVRKDKSNIDFGIWSNISTSKLYLPLDVHTGNVSRKLKILTRNQNDWKSVEEVTANLKKIDANDPVKYDFALFGLGIHENF